MSYSYDDYLDRLIEENSPNETQSKYFECPACNTFHDMDDAIHLFEVDELIESKFKDHECSYICRYCLKKEEEKMENKEIVQVTDSIKELQTKALEILKREISKGDYKLSTITRSLSKDGWFVTFSVEVKE